MLVRLFPIAALSLSLFACQPIERPEDMASVLPDDRLLAPEQVMNAHRSLGERSEFAEVTSNVVNDTNDTIVEVLALLENVTSYSASWSDASRTTAVWGPYQEDGLELMFTIVDQTNGEYDWALSIREVGAPDYSDLLLGSVEDDSGSQVGTFAFNLDVVALLDPTVTEMGQLVVDYDIVGEEVQVGMLIDFQDGRTEAEAAVAYGHDGSEAGWMDLGLRADLQGSETSAQELTLIHSRWDGAGAGRADAVVTEGDAGVFRYFVTECWGESGGVVYEDSSLDLTTSGDQSDCAYSDADFREDV